MRGWYSKAHQVIDALQCPNLPPIDTTSTGNSIRSDSEVDVTSPGTLPSPSSPGVTEQDLRLRSMWKLSTVVSGTGKLVQLLSGGTEEEAPTDEEAQQGPGEPQYLPAFKIDTPHMHSDDDLDAVGPLWESIFRLTHPTGRPTGAKEHQDLFWMVCGNVVCCFSCILCVHIRLLPCHHLECPCTVKIAEPITSAIDWQRWESLVCLSLQRDSSPWQFPRYKSTQRSRLLHGRTCECLECLSSGCRFQQHLEASSSLPTSFLWCDAQSQTE